MGSSALLIRLIRRFQLYVLGDCYLLALAALGEGSAEKNDSFIQLQAGYSALTRPFALLKRHKEEQQNKTKTKTKLSHDPQVFGAQIWRQKCFSFLR